jgi:hypothetical protein
MNCTASIDLRDQLVISGKISEESTSSYADEGTAAHDWAADLLNNVDPTIPDESLGCDLEEMQHCVERYVKHCRMVTDEGDTVFVEEKVPLFYREQDKGTVDYAAVNPKQIKICDLKYGKGVEVEAKDNPQLATYALSLVNELEIVFEFEDDADVFLCIYQPRFNRGNPFKVWTLKLHELREYCKQIQLAVVAIHEDKTVFAPADDTCQFCPCKVHCKPRASFLADNISEAGIEAAEQFTDLTEEVVTSLPVPSDDLILTDQQIAAVVKHGPGLIKWVNSVTKGAYDSLKEGHKIEGLKLVEGKPGNRKWADEQQADTLIKSKLKADERYTRKLITLPQAEKKLKALHAEKPLSTRFWNRFKELTFRQQGAEVMVPDDDPREALTDPTDELELLD